MRPNPIDPRLPEDEEIKFFRNGAISTLSIWAIKRVCCTYVRENPFSLGSIPYYELWLESGKLLKINPCEIDAIYLDIDERYHHSRNVLYELYYIDRMVSENQAFNRSVCRYSDWLQEKYKIDLIQWNKEKKLDFLSKE
jgi:hypothetical protein